ncbi:hypothetical protein DIT71_03720 [Marinobacter vulgaris]|uniref:Uncharacterized protein n=1 Tax=Marinobacter vulgaris TaxID=1928331 RepID=A0A2V3ZME6_9GAMM|nr:hypothetical protein [Marinobacter vulgaris]PXX92318.1 hypothetical protein DIT71_03720 [Marinobacter vulgaris]TSJ71739.1 hypothetical protein FPC41_05750 [Marinobacter vulgaris]
MKTQTVFREIDSLISVVEAMQRDLSTSTFNRLKTVEGKRPFLRVDGIQSWVEGKSASFFQIVRTINQKAEKLSESYIDFTTTAPSTSRKPVNIDINDI